MEEKKKILLPATEENLSRDTFRITVMFVDIDCNKCIKSQKVDLLLERNGKAIAVCGSLHTYVNTACERQFALCCRFKSI